MHPVIQQLMNDIPKQEDDDKRWDLMLKLRSIIERNYRGHFADHELFLTTEEMGIQINLDEQAEIGEAIRSLILVEKRGVVVGQWIAVLEKAHPKIIIDYLQDFFIKNHANLSLDGIYKMMLVLGECYVCKDDIWYEYIKAALQIDDLTNVYESYLVVSDENIAKFAEQQLKFLKIFVSEESSTE